MSGPDDPYAPPTRDREAGGPAAPRPPHVPYAPPSGRADDRLPPPGRGGRLGVAAVATGLLAVVLGVTVVGGVLLGALALLLGFRDRARARATGRGAGAAVAGIALGLAGLAVAAATYAYVRPHLEEFQGCRKESVSLAQDAECERQLRRGIAGD